MSTPNGRAPATGTADLRGMQGAPGRAQPGGTGSGRLDSLVKALENVQLSDQHDLHEALEAFRALGHRLAVEAMMMAGALEEGTKATARANSRVGVVGISAHRKIRRTVKAFQSMADGFAGAAGSAVAAWNAFCKDFEDDLSVSKTKTKAHKGFAVNPN